MKRPFIFVIFSLLAVMGNAQTLKFARHHLDISSERYTDAINIVADIEFAIKKSSSISGDWCDYTLNGKSLSISIAKNQTGKVRTCRFVIYNVERNMSDTLVVRQKIAVSGSKTNMVGTRISNRAIGSSASRKVATTNRSASRSSSTRSRISSGQCAATTKKGYRCSRRASAGSAYCWQHQ